VNFGAHIVVAERVGARPLPAAAPDLVHMARLALAPEVDAAHHHRADAAFHELAWFRRRTSELSAELQAHGVRRGPARGAAHVAVELLLDGAVLADDEAAAAFAPTWATLAEAEHDEVAGLVPEPDRPAWRDFLDRLTSRLDPYAYADPAYAAERTAGTLARRPRLALEDEEHAVLSALARPVDPDEARQVLEEVVQRL
jgi:hypothetical protein